ncbi:dynein light chain Tctex-type 4-like [Echinops telfairi]|uniref:Dynein light chain Tctex-type 4-like n=1 Tax=Echinops telfairi TaxID=9371 RepID=A0ABM0IGQ5_ECHTE|nr:dynein light chain Tctex-type 4-like [Echinops telfairi]
MARTLGPGPSSAAASSKQDPSSASIFSPGAPTGLQSSSAQLSVSTVLSLQTRKGLSEGLSLACHSALFSQGLGMTTRKSRRATDEVSREPADKGVTFTGPGSCTNGKKPAGHPSQGNSAPPSGTPSSRRGASRAAASESPDADAAMLSLRGLLAARRITRELKNRTSSRTKSRLQLDWPRPVSIIQEQVPLWSARPEVKFPCVQAQELMQAHLPSTLAGVAYHPTQCAHLAESLSAEIRDLVKTVTPPRYKLVCAVSIGSKGQDDVTVTSQSLWDPHSDSFATSQYVSPTLFCVALVHAVYWE